MNSSAWALTFSDRNQKLHLHPYWSESAWIFAYFHDIGMYISFRKPIQNSRDIIKREIHGAFTDEERH